MMRLHNLTIFTITHCGTLRQNLNAHFDSYLNQYLISIL